MWEYEINLDDLNDNEIKILSLNGLYIIPTIGYDLGGDGDIYIKEEHNVKRIGFISICDGASALIYQKDDDDSWITISYYENGREYSIKIELI